MKSDHLKKHKDAARLACNRSAKLASDIVNRYNVLGKQMVDVVADIFQFADMFRITNSFYERDLFVSLLSDGLFTKMKIEGSQN